MADGSSFSKNRLKEQPQKDAKKSKRKAKSEREPVPEPEPTEPKPSFKRIYLYMHLEQVFNLPETDNDVVLCLAQSKNTITKLVDHYTTKNCINLTATFVRGEPVPTFSVMIDQDSIEEMNIFSDNPLVLTMYDYTPAYMRPVQYFDENGELLPPKKIKRTEKVEGVGDEEQEEEQEEIEMEEVPEVWEPIGQGSIDMLQFFSQRRNLQEVSIFIYPVSRKVSFESVASKLIWNIYSLFPLLKETSYSNLAFITVESIYNVNPSILEDENQVYQLDLSFQSKLINQQGEYDKIKFCTFSTFNLQTISSQNSNIRWETIIDAEMGNLDSLGIQSGCKLDTHKLRQNLLTTEGVNFEFENIDDMQDQALICNSLHRFVLTNELCTKLQEVVAFNEQQILLELFRPEQPEEVLYQGILDMSIFLYPRGNIIIRNRKVNAIRYAVELRPLLTTNAKIKEPVKPKETSQKPAKGKGKEKQSKPISRPKDKVAFAVIGMCLLSPLTEAQEHIANNSGNKMRKDQLSLCTALEPEKVKRTFEQIIAETYHTYDDQIGMLIDFIVRKELKSTVDTKKYFCCQLGNLVNKMIKLIAYDFNTRVPTDNIIDFTNLMTMVYDELTLRQYNILQNCSNNDLAKCYIEDPERQKNIIFFMNITKYLFEVGDKTMGQLIFDKIKTQNTNNCGLNFYIFLYDVERKDFEAARTYLQRPIREKYMEGQYFASIADLYIEYMEKLQDVKTSAEAYEYLLIKLTIFLEQFPLEIDGWILLYCLYKNCRYMPGMSFARWKYENLYFKPRKYLPLIPKSLWEIYNNNKLNVTAIKAVQFNTVLDIFLRLGLYKFAEYIFMEISSYLLEPEKYFVVTTLMILQNQVAPKYPAKQFPTDKLLQGHVIRAFQSQINGSLDFAKGNIAPAMANYSKIIDITNLQDFQDFQLGLLRYGYHMMELHQYERAIQAFEKCCVIAGNCMVSYIYMGKAMYFLGRLKSAEYNFAESTKFQMHIPNAWAYLALVNLKMGNNFKALESWKYAKIDPENVISQEILAELEAINYSDVSLYVDKPMSL